MTYDKNRDKGRDSTETPDRPGVERSPNRDPLEADGAGRERRAGGRPEGTRPEGSPAEGGRQAGADNETVANSDFDGRAKFGLGQRIFHRLFDYRGLVFDVDPSYQGTEKWYAKMARSNPPRNEPWYHVLVHEAEHTTYVAERNLEVDPSEDEIDHPLVPELFDLRDDGAYRPHQDLH